ncbi:hypothetical protein [Nitrosococcus watsonii]|uniref:Bacterial OB-fold domain-containing protein n=1 Tax=Nitrosococcus watsoni (strain C-113) TaxID=105559 RepID=D8KA35_NITWC|nr:hypothetical protein [Nitrosococcus watsonii]ADJ29393.1 conserved hypothetical protein [Nitrosococcus watsonii C-113]
MKKIFWKERMGTLPKMTIAAMASAALMSLPALGIAQTAVPPSPGADQSSRMGGQQASGQAQTVEDVKKLLKNIERYDGQKVTVSGEVEERIDKKAFILESGGIFNDEIVVIVPKGNLNVQEDDEVTVTGTVRSAKFADIENEYQWVVNEEIKDEIEDTKAFLIADHVDITEQDD